MAAELLKGHLDSLVLAVLEVAPAHGYAVIGALRERSDGAFDLAEGTVYPALHRLERQGLVNAEWSDHAGRPRRMYRITRKGRRALAGQRLTWTGFSRAVDRVLGAVPAS